MLLDDAEPVVNLLNGMHLHEKEQHPPFVLHGNDSRADMATLQRRLHAVTDR